MNLEPVFGDLAHWPLRAEVWGTAGNWAAAIGTSASVAAAAYYFIHNNRQAASAQAMMVSARLTAFDGNLRIDISNNSGASIYDIRISLQKRPFKEVLLDPTSSPILGMLAEIKKDWESGPSHVPLYIPNHPNPSIGAGQELSQIFNGVSLTDMYWCKLTFMDANSVHWKLVLRSTERMQRHDLMKMEFVSDRWEYEPEIFDQNVLDRFKYYWLERRKLKKWYRKNKPRKPKD